MKYLVNNCFFVVFFLIKISRQVIGIPIGLDPAPFFANLFLYRFESKWINKINELKKKLEG